MMIDVGKIGNGFTNDIMVWYHVDEGFYVRGGVLMPRDYHKAYEQIKDKKKLIGVQVYTQTAEDFKAKCYLNETTPNAFLKACIDAYLNNSLSYENGKLEMK